MANPVYIQEDFRGRNDDGSLATATWKSGSNNEHWTQDVDTVFRARFVVQQTNAAKTVNNQTFELWASYEGGGYFEVTTGSTYIKLTNDANSIPDNAATIQRIGDGTYGTGDSNGYDDGQAGVDTGDCDFNGAEEVELEFCLWIPSGDVVDEDTLDLQVRLSGGIVLGTYSNTPRVTVNEEVGGSSYDRTVTENIGLSTAETRAAEYGRVFAETMACATVAARRGTFNRSFGDNFALSTPALDMWGEKSVTFDGENVGFGDAFSRGAGFARTLDDTFALLDAREFAAIYARTVADTLGWDDDVQFPSGAEPLLVSESLGFGDAVTRALLAARLVSETLAIADTVVRAAISARLVTETLAIATDLSASVSGATTILVSDGLGLVDGLTREAILNRVFSDTLAVADSPGRAVGFSCSVIDTVAVADSAVWTAAFARTVSVTLAVADSTAWTAAFARTVSETLAVADAMTRQATLARVIGETLAIATDFSVLVPGGTTILVSDALGLVDGLTREAILNRVLSDTLAVEDAAIRSGTFPRSFTDTLGVADSTEQAAGFSRSVIDTLGVGDTAAWATAYARTVTETLGVAETMTRSAVLNRIVTETLGWTTIILVPGAPQVYSRQITESLGLGTTWVWSWAPDPSEAVYDWRSYVWEEVDTFGWPQWNTFLWGGIAGQIEAAQIFVSGAVAGEIFVSGAVAGEIFVAGGQAGEVD